MARSKSYQKKRRAANKRFILSIALILVATSAYHIYSTRAMDKEIEALDAEIISNTKKIEHINEEIVNLESDFEIRNTDTFKEKIAEERLGMVKEENSDGN